jgi:hypothetical protein
LHFLPGEPTLTHARQRHHFCHHYDHSLRCIIRGEAEYAALFTGGQHAAGLRTILADMGYPQPPTTILSDNTSAIGLANDTIKQKRSKAIDIRFHWIRDRIRQNQFGIVYIPTKENIADYMTKNLPKELHDRFTF